MNPEPTPTSENTRGNTRRLKKRIIIAMLGMAFFIVLAMVLLTMIDRMENDGYTRETEDRHAHVIFADPDYEYDIMQDEEYLALNRYIFYADSTSGITVMLDDKNLHDYGPAVPVLKSMIDAVIAGDVDAYNALFSANYTAEHALEEPFTMQQVYDIMLTMESTSEVQPKEGKSYIQYEFRVEYKIHKNNGTFRTDLGHDDSRPLYFVLSDSAGSEVLIDDIIAYSYE